MEGVDASQAASIVDSMLSTMDLKELLATAVVQLGQVFRASRALVLLLPDKGQKSFSPVEWTADESDPSLDAALLNMARFVQRLALRFSKSVLFPAAGADPLLSSIKQELDVLGVGALLAVTARVQGVPNSTLILCRSSDEPSWREEDIQTLDYIARFLGLAVSNCQPAARLSAPAPEQVKAAGKASPFGEENYRRLVDNSDAVIFHVDTEHVLRFISNRSEDLFGLKPSEVESASSIYWYELSHPEDRERIKQRAREHRRLSESFEEEFRVFHRQTGKERWLLAKFVAIFGRDGQLQGWDGFALDISGHREAQQALDAQSRKIRALYTVSAAIGGYIDPANIASRGLAALCEATGADAGMCYLYPSKDSRGLSLLAYHGFSVGFAERSDLLKSLGALSAQVAEQGQSLFLPDLRSDPRCDPMLAREEGMLSAVLVPVSVEEETLGTLALFHREAAQFDGGDVMLIAAAANQIGLAARQANLFAAYRKQTKRLAALYRLSHELSGFLTLDEIFQRAFGIIQDELDLRRLWLGLLNQTGTRIIGTAAYGPGWKKRLVEMNVEVAGRDHPIAQVVTSRKAMIIQDAEKILSRFGLRRFFSRYSISEVGLVPLVSGGQVLGVLAFQPDVEEVALDEEQVTLISSLASEIAAIVLAKRLEERIAQGEKMRAAGLLAAGIAHNFNNLLQAILGQASLLEMQFPREEKVQRPARTINEAATKGAALVRQLVSFANLEEPKCEVSDVNAVIERGLEALARDVSEKHQIVLKLAEGLPRAYVDAAQIMRILATLVRNASEAMEKPGVIQVFTSIAKVDRESPHYEVPYGTYVCVGVRDEGVGMDPETRRRCFEPFYTTKNLDPNSGLSLSGAGLGLAAAYALTRKNGGRLVADSRRGQGSLFTLYLPVNQTITQEDEEVYHTDQGSGTLRKTGANGSREGNGTPADSGSLTRMVKKTVEKHEVQEQYVTEKLSVGGSAVLARTQSNASEVHPPVKLASGERDDKR